MGWTTFKPDTTITPEKRMWCAAHLDPLTTKVLFKDAPIDRWTDQDGNKFRVGFTITVAPAHGDKFIVKLRAGASLADLERAHRMIKAAKGGLFAEDLWRPVTFTNGFDGWALTSGLVDGDKYDADELRPCNEKLCVSDYHVYYGDEAGEPCNLEPLESKDGSYTVYGEQHADEGWTVWASTDELPEGIAGLKALRNLANDYAWMQAECDKLNNLALDMEAAA